MSTATLSQHSIDSVNPATGEVMKSYEEMSPEAVESAIASAHEAFQQWKTTTFDERASILRNVANLMRERKDELATLMSREMGKLVSHAQFEIDLCIQIFEYYANHGAELLAPKNYNTEDGVGQVIYQPLGVVYGIQPWNMPLYQPSRFVAPNLMAGNVVLTKHASNVPQSAQAFDDLLHDAGVPDGVHTNLILSGRNAGKVIDDERVQGISFTGSNAGGGRVASRAGALTKKLVLELGGNDPFIVLDDADLDVAMQQLMIGKFNSNGQVCIAPKRIILHEAIAETFLQRMVEQFDALRPGDPLDPNTGYGPLSSEAAAIEVEEQVTKSVQAGAKLVLGGTRDGAFFAPTILTNIPQGSPAYEDEIFGPVASVFVVPDEQAAIELANNSSYGLGGSVYTRDKARGRRVAEAVESGSVFVNHVEWSFATMPMGGVKKSGYGRELGDMGILEFVNQKLICEF